MEADHIALAVDDTEGVPLPLAIYRSVYIEFAGIAASAATVVIYVAGALDSTWAGYCVVSPRISGANLRRSCQWRPASLLGESPCAFFAFMNSYSSEPGP